MTPEQFKKIREAFDQTQAQWGATLRLKGMAGRSIRAFENGETPLPGVVQLAVEAVLMRHALTQAGVQPDILLRLNKSRKGNANETRNKTAARRTRNRHRTDVLRRWLRA